MTAGQAAPAASTLDALALQDRVIAGIALGVVTLGAWAYLLARPSVMPGMAMAGMPAMTTPMLHPWSWVEIGGLVVMWTVMMIAMMTPSAAPMTLIFATVHRRRAAAGRPAVPTLVFVLGYVVVWTVYGIAAALAQGALHGAAFLSPAMAVTGPLAAGGLLIAAGVFQGTPLKRACLAACRSPLSFLMARWREGRWGAFTMGLRHGQYCLGCCWALMSLLFVAGVMNLLWVAAITVAVLLEKVAPRGDVVGRRAGLALVAAGVLLIVRGLIL